MAGRGKHGPLGGRTVRTYRLSESDYRVMREKIGAAQTLLNCHAIAEMEGHPPPSADVRLELAEEAEELVHDVADLLDRLSVEDGPAQA